MALSLVKDAPKAVTKSSDARAWAERAESAVQSARKAASRMREELKTAPGSVLGGGALGAVAAGMVDTLAPSVVGMKPSIILGGLTAVYAIQQDDVMASGAAVGMLSPHLYGVGAGAGAMLGAAWAS